MGIFRTHERKISRGGMKIVLRLLKYIKPYRRHLSLASLSMLLFVIFNMVTVVIMIPFVNVLFSKDAFVPTSVPEHFEIDTMKEYGIALMNNLLASIDRIVALRYLCVFLVTTFLLKNIFHYFEAYYMAIPEQGIIRDLRRDLYSHLHKLSLSFFTEEKKGNLMSRIVNDVKIVNDAVLAFVNSVFRDPPQIIVYTVILLLIDWKLTIIVFFMMPITGWILTKISNYLKRKSQKLQETMADLTSVLDETLSGIRIVKAFNMEDFEIRKFRVFNDSYFKTFVRIIKRKELSSPITEFLSVLVVVIILWFMGESVLRGTNEMSAGLFVGYFFAMLQLMQPLKFMGQMFNSVAEGIAAGERIFSILDIQPRILDKPGAIDIHSFNREITFTDVKFQYDTGDVVLELLNASICAGQVVAIVGPSGAGKSTMVDLIPRFYDVTGGCITIDGIDLRDISVSSLRGLMGIVTQETILFNDTVKNNIAYGIESISMSELVKAAQAANAHEFIMELPKQYDTIIGDRGVKLSGGQRQRLSLARAILKNPPILILDEATSSLDTESEKLVQAAIVNLMQGRTSIVIAHRLSTIQRADVILVLSDGRIVESGKHEELLQNGNGIYRKLYELQFEDA